MSRCGLDPGVHPRADRCPDRVHQHRSAAPRRRPPNPANGNLALGLQEFTLNCAGCHQIVARGGITVDAQVPDLQQATAQQIAEAVRMGPYLMPHFDATQIDQHELDSIARYVLWTRHPDRPRRLGDLQHRPDPRGDRGLVHRPGRAGDRRPADRRADGVKEAHEPDDRELPVGHARGCCAHAPGARVDRPTAAASRARVRTSIPRERTVPANRRAETLVAVLLLLAALFGFAFTAIYIVLGAQHPAARRRHGRRAAAARRRGDRRRQVRRPAGDRRRGARCAARRARRPRRSSR